MTFPEAVEYLAPIAGVTLEREEVEKREVVVQLKNVYGNDLIYPVCGNAKKFSALVGKKTFSRTEIAWIKDLGFEVKVEAQQL